MSTGSPMPSSTNCSDSCSRECSEHAVTDSQSPRDTGAARRRLLKSSNTCFRSATASSLASSQRSNPCLWSTTARACRRISCWRAPSSNWRAANASRTTSPSSVSSRAPEGRTPHACSSGNTARQFPWNPPLLTQDPGDFAQVHVHHGASSPQVHRLGTCHDLYRFLVRRSFPKPTSVSPAIDVSRDATNPGSRVQRTALLLGSRRSQ